MADLVGQLQAALAGRYLIDRRLAEGGMGIVLLAEEPKHDRKVVLKVLSPELAHALGADRFLREIHITAQLTHPNILTLIDSGTAGDFTYYVLPYVEGESLRDRLDREGQLPIDDAVRIACEVADALGYAHGHGIVHRDIKPENILLEAGHAVVADFGIAHAVSEAGGEQLTKTGMAVGTPAYMSPEQATASELVDGRSDVYSLACVLYEMLAGAPPFTGPTPQAVLARKALGTVPGLRVVRDTVPPATEAAILRALARVPADRYETAHEFAEALSDRGREAVARGRPRGLPRGRLATLASAIVVVAAATYVVLAISGRLDTGPGTIPTSSVHLTVDPGGEWFPSFSPDGQWIVFSGGSSGNRDIYLQSVGGQNAIDLTADSPADDDEPAFSPDGGRIAFRSERNGGGIFVMGRTGEAVRRVTRAGFRPTWSPDGTRIAFSTVDVVLHPENATALGELWIADVATGETRRVADVDAALPSWSPHGRRIAFLQRLERTAGGKVWTVPPDGGEAAQATDGASFDWSPAWSPDGRYLYFVSDRGGSKNLWRVRIDEDSGRTLADPEPVMAPGTSLAHVAVAADGKHIAYSSVLFTANVQKSAFDPARAVPVGDPEWVTRGTRRWSDPEPSPDNRQVALYSLDEPPGDVYLAAADGVGAPRQILADSAYDRMPRWSPDGEWIAVFSDRNSSLQIWKVRPDGSDLTRLTDTPTANAVWSPDGRRMAAGAVGGGQALVFDPDRPLHEQEPEVLPAPPDSLEPFVPHSWSPDGERLAGMISSFDQGVVIYDFAYRTYEHVTDFGQWPVWLPDGRRLLFVSGGHGFYVVDRESRVVRKVLSVDRDVIGPPQLSRDGRWVYYTRSVTEADIWMLTLR